MLGVVAQIEPLSYTAFVGDCSCRRSSDLDLTASANPRGVFFDGRFQLVLCPLPAGSVPVVLRQLGHGDGELLRLCIVSLGTVGRRGFYTLGPAPVDHSSLLDADLVVVVGIGEVQLPDVVVKVEWVVHVILLQKIFLTGLCYKVLELYHDTC